MYRGLLGFPTPPADPLQVKAGASAYAIRFTISSGSSTVYSLFCGATETISVRRNGALIITGDSSTPAVLGGNSPFRTGSLALGFDMSGGSGVAFCGDAFGASPTSGANSTGFILSAQARLRWSSSTMAATPDLELCRDAANTLAQRNGTNVQTFRLYETFTNTTNGAWLSLEATSSRYEISGKANGTGNVRPILLNQGAVAIASLPSASAAGAGARMVVNNALSPTWGAIVSAGGTVVSPVYSDGINWRVG